MQGSALVTRKGIKANLKGVMVGKDNPKGSRRDTRMGEKVMEKGARETEVKEGSREIAGFVESTDIRPNGVPRKRWRWEMWNRGKHRQWRSAELGTLTM